MKNCKRLTLIFILLVVIAAASTVFVACNQDKPYYGTYYMEKDKTPMVIDKDYVTFLNQKYEYEYADGVLTMSSGSKIRFAENYQVAYFPLADGAGLNGKIRVRNGNFAVQFMYDGTYYYFKRNGAFQIVDSSSYTVTNGSYTLKDGVLLMTNTYSTGTSGYTSLGNSYFWYIDNDYNIFVFTLVKDYTKFLNNTDDTPSNPSGTPDSGNIGDSDDNGSSQKNAFTVTWKNYDGTVLKTDYYVPEGSTPYYYGDTPTREASDGYVYSFAGWSPSLTAIYGDTTYTAQFTSSSKNDSYTVTWKNYDGTVLETDYVASGGKAVYNGKTPTRPSDEGYTYSFSGWGESTGYIYRDTTFTAQFDTILAIPNLPANTKPLLGGANRSFEGDGTEESPYLVKTYAQLLGMGAYADRHFALANDITLPLNGQDRPNFSPLFSDEKPFNATFDGRGYTISNLYIYNTDTYYTGLFASVGESGVVKNLKLADVRIFGGNYVGAVAGLSVGSITDCEASGNITYVPANNYQVYVGGIVGRGNLDKCNTAVEIKVFDFNSTIYVGGLAGYSTSEAISDSSNAGNIIVKTTNRNSGGTYVGGLVGSGASSPITNSYNTGDIAVRGRSYGTKVGGLMGVGSSITSSYNTGNVTVEGIGDFIGEFAVGGLVGAGTTIASSYNTGNVSVEVVDRIFMSGSRVSFGGLAGISSITSSYNTGDITVQNDYFSSVGGLVGDGSSITNSYNTGDITVESGSDTHVGGLVGDGSSITNSYNTGDITVSGGSDTRVGGLGGSFDQPITITSSYNTGKITVTGGSDAYVGGLAGYGSVTLKNSHWLYYTDGAPVNAVGYNSGMGVPTNIGATKHTAIGEFYDLADTLNEGLTEPAFEHKTSSSLPTLIKKEN